MRAFLVFLGMPRSKNLIWILALAALGYFFGQQPYVVRGGNLRNQVLSYDVAGYYAYLPMLFVERDLRLEKTWKYDMIQLVGVHEHPVSSGRHLKFTAGMAYLYAPFFAAAHAYTLATNPEEAHGFSLPYRFGIGLAGVVYPLVGLVFLRRFLRHYVPDAAISWTLFALFLGTNLFYYSSFRGAMSHGATFMLGAAMLYQADLWRRREQVWRLGVLGVLAGLIVLIRPVNVLIPLAVAAMFTMDGRLPKGLLTPKSLAVALGLAVVVGIPQLLYWKASTGHWIVWTYGAERFFWSQPAWIQGLFSWRKGWLLYTPMVAFILLGFWGLARKKLAWMLALILTCAGLIGLGVSTNQPGASFFPELALDLQGGTSIILSPTVAEGATISTEQLNQAVAIIRARVDSTGVSESTITTSGNSNIVVEIPGVPSETTLQLIKSSANWFRFVFISKDHRRNTPAHSLRIMCITDGLFT
jgi:hypothetical protein